MSWGKRVSKHHHRGVNNDLLTLPRRGGNLSSSATSVQSQGELSAVTIQLHLMPLSIIEAVVWQGQVVVSISKVVENSQQTLNNLRYTVELCWFEMQAFKQTREARNNKDVLIFWIGSRFSKLHHWTAYGRLQNKLVCSVISCSDTICVNVDFKAWNGCANKNVKWGDTNSKNDRPGLLPYCAVLMGKNRSWA